ncbi:MAG: hydantoinase/oxoprolinase family protein [Alphaproteobacteria bacterium]|nr:MAG: hydantoinase/oxoprolinase family protein [Alphaproteobacteria bacterium]
MLLMGVDIGGTFTDVVLTDTQSAQTHVHKVSSTPHDPSIAMLTGALEICEQAGVAPQLVRHILHGTTVATNAMLEHRGVKTGMITTEGFRDILEIGRHQRPQHYSIQQDIPWQSQPLIRRRYRKTVRERLAPPRGEVIEPLDEEAVRQAVLELAEAGVEAIAICFLFSYLNPAHEIRAEQIVQETCPDLFVTRSSDVAPQFREFERFTTTAMNAFIGPLVRDYVLRLDTALREAGFNAELHIMRSNGGIGSVKMVSRQPVTTLMSGLAAGILGASWVGKAAGHKNVIALDIGGTSADIGVVTDGRFSMAAARDTEVAGYPVLTPMIDLHTIGAGGGSIAHIHQGAFKVGPRSAGATPGPAAYGRGGTQPTVTDANVVLGRIAPKNFLGGNMAIDVDAARAVLGDLAEALGMSVEETAEGVISVLNANMANAIRARTIQKGIDPRNYALVAAGGAGPLHGAEVARMLSIPQVIIPPYPGINSAIGLLTTDLTYENIRTAFQILAAPDTDRLNRDFHSMQQDIGDQFRLDGVDDAEVRYLRTADARYVGQGYELMLPLPDGPLDSDTLRGVAEVFHDQHRREYGHAFEGTDIELVNIRLVGIGTMPKISALSPSYGRCLDDALVDRAPAIFRIRDSLQTFETRFYDRSRLPPDTVIEGPAVFLQTDSTTLLPPDAKAHVEPSGSIIITIGDAN